MTLTIAPRFRTLLLLLLAVFGALLAGAAPASAHAALTGSNPTQGSVVDKAPAQVSLTFSEQVSLNDKSLQVLDPKGGRVDAGSASDLGGDTYGLKLRPGLPDGTYTVTYQVVSADSHPVSGAFTFSVGAPSQTSVALSDQAAGGGVVGVLYGTARYFSYAGFILLVGGAAFVLGCWQRGSGIRPVQRVVVSGWLTLTASTLALLLLRGSYVGSGKVGDIFDLTLLGEVLQTKSGAALVSRLLLLAAAALFIAVLFGAYAKRDEDERAAATARAGDTTAARTAGPETAGTKESAGEADTKTVATKAVGAKAAGTHAVAAQTVTAKATRGEPAEAANGGPEDAADTDADNLAAEKNDLTFGLAIGGAVVAAGLAATWAMAEHASTGVQPGIAMPVDVLHLLAVAVWLGGLSTLVVALFRAPAQAQIEATAVRRFSRLAFGAVLVLVTTGIYQSWRQLGSWSALTDTTYGQLLLVKVGLVALLVGIAWISRRWTAQLAEETAPEAAAVVEQRSAPRTPATVPADSRRAAQLARQQAAVASTREKRVRDADPHRSGLRRSVLAEAGVAVVLLAVTTALTTTEPGRTAEAARQATASASQRSGPLSLKIPFDTGGEDGKGTVEVTLDPARVGGNEMHVFVVRPNGKAFDVPEVKVAFTLAAKDVGPLPVTPDRVATGHWAANGVQIPMAGDWKIAVTVRTSDIDQATVIKNAQIG
ncbi:copper resistance CopC/CopD family protein [Streptomyces rhizosphaerihabitans]|uniref:copper resistance CopC/CopD family protein n=1 Tax=Streptomyces rhizosphaerihabitans TaxID=1266770 RepID=UPI0021C05B99|nr:copper resistance protein CopC [Streptomyces rhizosphaerihabitans]MCT9005400.1 copper resistance protein CopC [Streptomyces rhizosphaerihabitans]